MPRQQHLRDQDLASYSGFVSAALASVLMHELASVMLTHRAARRAIETWDETILAMSAMWGNMDSEVA